MAVWYPCIWDRAERSFAFRAEMHDSTLAILSTLKAPRIDSHFHYYSIACALLVWLPPAPFCDFLSVGPFLLPSTSSSSHLISHAAFTHPICLKERTRKISRLKCPRAHAIVRAEMFQDVIRANWRRVWLRCCLTGQNLPNHHRCFQVRWRLAIC
jgi:hypothetical protein